MDKKSEKNSFALPQLDGIIILDKPKGPSSARCLVQLKRLGQKKIGHAGTLDPMASGVLIVLLGQATKLSGLIQGEKTYNCELMLGVETDTWDMEGRILRQCPTDNLENCSISRELLLMKGKQIQEVPPFSAAKHNGQPLYKLARKGHDVPVKLKTISVFEVELLNISMPFVNFRVTCSSGSYIRSLAHSLGKRLGCGAALSGLVREISHPFSLGHAISPEEIAKRPEVLIERLISPEKALPDWPVIQLGLSEAKKIRNGQPVAAPGMRGQKAVLFFDSTPLALAEHTGQNWKIIRGLWN